MGGVIRTVSVALKMQVADFVAGGAKAAGTLKALGAETDHLAKTSKAKFNDISKVSLGIGAALVAVAGYAVKAGYDFDKQMSEVRAVSGATGVELGALRDAAIEAGKRTQYSATEAAKAESELAKAGIDSADILGGALKGSLALAAAGQMDLADAATISAQAMNIFGLKGTAVTHIADVLASSANASAADMHGLGDSLRAGGLVASQMGLGLEDTVGVLSAFADNALIGSDAGTSLKTMLLALEKPTAAASRAMAEYGITTYDAGGKFVGIANFAGQLHDKLAGLTDQQRNSTLATIFGADAVRAASILYKDGATDIQGYIDKVNVNGAAADTARIKMDNLAGDVEQLRGSLETLAIESSGGARDGLRQLTQAATGTVNAFADLPGWLQQGIVELSGIAGVSLLAGTGILKARGAVNDFKEALSGMGPAGDKASKALGAVSKWGGIAAAAGVAGYALFALFDHLHKSAQPAALDIDKLTDSLSKFSTESRVTGELKTLFGGETLDDFSKRVAEYKRLVAEVATFNAAPTGVVTGEQRSQQQATALFDAKPIAEFNKNIADTDTAFAQMVKNGQAVQAASDMNLFQDAAIKGGMSLQEFNALFPQYTQAAQDASLAAHGVAQGFGSVTEKTNLMTGSLAAAVEQAGSLLALENKLNGANISLMQATDGLEAAYDAASAAVKKNGETANKQHTALLATTDAGRANREALLAIADAASKASQATLDQTGSLDKANDVLKVAHDNIVTLAMKMGLSKTAAEKLADSMLKVPDINPKVNVDTGKALTSIQRIRTELDKLHGKVVNVTVVRGDINRGGSSASANRWGGIYTHAADGLLRDASIYSAKSPARYAFAEPGTGGEAFIPKYGNPARSIGILGRAASWYGMSVGHAGGGGGGGVLHLHITAAPGHAQAMLESLRFAIKMEGGGPVKVLTPR